MKGGEVLSKKMLHLILQVFAIIGLLLFSYYIVHDQRLGIFILTNITVILIIISIFLLNKIIKRD